MSLWRRRGDRLHPASDRARRHHESLSTSNSHSLRESSGRVSLLLVLAIGLAVIVFEYYASTAVRRYLSRHGDVAEPEPAEPGMMVSHKEGQLVGTGRGGKVGQQQQLESLSRIVEAGHPLSRSHPGERSRPERQVTGERAICKERRHPLHHPLPQKAVI